jgi:hypothetical protein
MHGKDLKVNVLPRNRMLTAEESRKFHSAPLVTWLATVALVMIVIGVALSVAAWKEPKKKTEAVARITALSGLGTVLGSEF